MTTAPGPASVERVGDEAPDAGELGVDDFHTRVSRPPDGSGVVARVGAVALTGLVGEPVTAEAVGAGGLFGIHIVGLPDATVREAAERIHSACTRSGFSLPSRKVVVNLAPAGIRKVGPGFDLPIALAVVIASGHLPADAADGVVAWGEVGLSGEIRHAPGILPVASTARATSARRLVVPRDSLAEANLVDGLDVVAVDSLSEAVRVLRYGVTRDEPRPAPVTDDRTMPDLSDVRGQAVARRGLEIAAAGGHHLLLVGPPGCGKSMLARRLPGILPLLRHDQALQVAAVRSILGERVVLDLRPPFRDPHHGTSTAGLIGGGSGVATPGEVSRAHCGVLFLDELLETPRSTLDALREPLETGSVVLVRSRARVEYPAAVQLVAATNPCPCGHAGSANRPCTCRPDQLERYRARLSGPLADRIDLHLRMEAVTEAQLVGPSDGEPTAVVAARVAAARQVAASRWDGVNRDADPAAVRATVAAATQRRLARAIDALGWSARSFDRCLLVARTIADLAEEAVVGNEHVDEAIAHRSAMGGG